MLVKQTVLWVSERQRLLARSLFGQGLDLDRVLTHLQWSWFSTRIFTIRIMSPGSFSVPSIWMLALCLSSNPLRIFGIGNVVHYWVTCPMLEEPEDESGSSLISGR